MVNLIGGNSKQSPFIRCGASGDSEKEKESPSVLARMVHSPYATAGYPSHP